MARSPLKRNIIFEIHALSDGRWTIHSTARGRTQSVDQAKELLATNRFEGVKVVREDEHSGEQEVIFEEERKGGGAKRTTITPVDEAPLCEDLEDFYGFEARKTISRLLRKYLDENGITVLELLHSPGLIRWLTRDEVLLNQAVQNIARIQARMSGDKPMTRVDRLYDAVNRMTDRARAAEDVDEYRQLLENKGMEALVKGVKKDVSADNRDFFIRAALAAYLGGPGDWEYKLGRVIDQAETGPGKLAFNYLDEIIAEVFDGAAAIKELLGYQRNLGESLQTMVQLSCGSYRHRKGAGACLDRLNALRANYDMPCTKDVLLERVEREINGVNPLVKGGQGITEKQAFKSLLGQLVRNKAIAEGGGIGEAVTMRARMVFSDGLSDATPEDAIDHILELLPTQAARFGYLVDLAGTDFGNKNQAHLVRRLAVIVKRLKSATSLVQPGAGKMDVILAAAGIRDRLLETHLPDEWRLRFARKIYTLLVEYQDGPQPASTKKAPAAKVPPKSSPDEPQLGAKTFEVGEFIFHEGDIGKEAYLIHSGEVEISRSAGDQEVVIAKTGRGSIIGEMALIDSKPRMATAKALKRTVLKIIPLSDLQMRLQRLEKSDPVMRLLVGMFVQRMRDHPIIEL